jgi:uncharacterized protein (DUF1330 family)
MSNAYFVGLIHVRDEAIWQSYVSQVGAVIAQYSGVVLFRGQQVALMSGSMPHEKVVTLQFADIASAMRWHDSPEYRRLIPIRDAAADVTLVLYG